MDELIIPKIFRLMLTAVTSYWFVDISAMLHVIMHLNAKSYDNQNQFHFQFFNLNKYNLFPNN